MPRHDLYCPSCEATRADVLVDLERMPRCACGTTLRCDFSHFSIQVEDTTPRYYLSLDKTLTKSELRAHLKAKGLQEVGDKVGGARNESHLGLGKAFSYAGQSRRSDNPLAQKRW